MGELNFIFDMDGVLVDTQKYHAKAERILFCEMGIDVSENEITRRFSGMSLEDEARELMGEHGVSADIGVLRAKKNRLYAEMLKGGVEEVQDALELVRSLSNKKAIATTAKRFAFNIIDAQLGLSQLFNAVVTGEEVAKGKPAPDIFLEAARRLEVRPENCVVIEDGRAGIEGAKKAGMIAVGFGLNVKGLGNFWAENMKELRQVLENIKT